MGDALISSTFDHLSHSKLINEPNVTYMMILISAVIGLFVAYLLITLFLCYLVHQIPRRPVNDTPDWGTVTDTRISAVDGGQLEVWKVEPETRSKGIVLFAHGWGRNRGRMVYRARIFNDMGYTTVMHSARDHGNSSPHRFMNAMRFSEDIEAVLDWIEEPVILYGHSAGSAGAIIAATRNPEQIERLFLEACYAYTKEALLGLYRWFNPFFGKYFAPMVLVWMDLYYRRGMDKMSPARLAPEIKIPVMIIHGEKDQRFPLSYAKILKESFRPGQASLYVAQGADHSDSSRQPGYKEAVKTFMNRQRSGGGEQMTEGRGQRSEDG
jgi:uncharacterized protein